MPRLTLRTLLAYIDDTLEPAEARSLGKKVAESDEAKQLVERIKKVTRRRGLAAPTADEDDGAGDPNTVAEYLDNALDSATLKQVEEICLESDVHLAEVAACHQILTLVLTEPVRVPPRAHHRMYGLVQPPASVPNRKPSKALTVSSAAPPVDGTAEADDADAALLFGMKRYSATTWATRLALFATAAALLVALGFSVMKSLPEKSTVKAPDVAKGPPAAYAGAFPRDPVVPPPKPAPEPAPRPDGKKDEGKKPDPPVAPMPKEKEPDPPAPKPEKEPDPKPLPKPVNADKWDEKDAPAAPLNARAAVGRLATDNTLVVAYRPQPNTAGANAWVRQPLAKPTDPDDANAVFSAEPVMALPGYKASVLLGELGRPAAVEVLLWGNVPEQLPYRVFESKVVFHKPQDGFDADVTLHAGRIYLKSVKVDAGKKSVPAKVRVRLAGSKEVWDFALPDADADVLVELISWYKPGTPYELKGAYEPRREARFAVVRGPVGFKAGNRFKALPDLAKGAEVRWDSAAGTLSDPAPNPNVQEFTRTPALEGNFQKVLGDALAEMARPGVLGVTLSGRVRPNEGTPNRDWVSRVAIYAWAAVAESNEAGCATLKELVELLNSELPFLSRQAAVTALVQWVGRDKGNTALLHALLTNPDTGIRPTRTADAVLEMLRGYVDPASPDPERLKELVKRLSGVDRLDSETKRPPAIALRDVALWNLVVADLGVWVPPPVGINVGAIDKFDTPEYEKFLNFWQTRVNEIIKKRTPPPKKP